MSIAALNQVYDEMRRLAIAGGDLARGDFRLQKLVEPLRASAAKAPVFGKVADGVQQVVDGPAPQSSLALLELSTLVTAILYTQGETGAAGKIAPIPSSGCGMPSSHSSARLLKPLIEALTSSGSGREEIIKDAHQRGAFQDLRLVRVSLGAIDDVYAPIADFVAGEILPMYGRAIYDDVACDFDPQARGGAVRRLKLLHRLDPEKTRPHVQAALDGGSADMKVAAIECLEGSQDALPFLLQQALARSTDVRRAALRAMATVDDPQVVSTLIATLAGKMHNTRSMDEMFDGRSVTEIELAAQPASHNRSPKLLKFLIGEGERRLGGLFTAMKKQANALLNEFYHFLPCFATRNDRQTIAFLSKCFDQRNEIGSLKGDVDGGQINCRVASLLLATRDGTVLKQLASVHATLPPDLLGYSWLAAARTRKPQEVFKLFAPYYLDTIPLKQSKKDDRLTKRDAVAQVLISFADRGHPQNDDARGADDLGIGSAAAPQDRDAAVDPRWLDAAIATDDLEVAMKLARPKHRAVQTYLAQQAEQLLTDKKAGLGVAAWKRRSTRGYRLSDVYETMIKIEHPQLVDHFMAALKSVAGKKQDHYYCYWLALLIPKLPKSAAARIEAELPSLGDKIIDQIAPYLSELQAKS